MMYKSVILKTEYLPPITSFWGALKAEKVWIEICENYQKKSTRNRTKIMGVNGIEVLSVPLKSGKNHKMPIKDVTIAYEDSWQSKHLHSIKSAYGNAPYFDFYFDSIADIISAKHDTLMNLNQKLLDYFIETIQAEINLTFTTKYLHQYGENDLDLRSIRFNDPEIKNYIPKPYNQVFEEKHGFIAGISILDLLMCKGPESILYI